MKLTQIPLLAIGALLTANLMQAAPEPRRERRPEPPPRREEAPPRREAPPEPLERILDEDQRQQLRETFRENRERLREIEEQVRDGRRELHEAMVKGKLDETDVEKKIEGIAKLEAERQIIRYKALAKIRPTLSDEQLERFQQLHARRQTAARDFPPGPGRPRQFRPDPREREFRPDPRERERYREQIAPRPPGEFDERPPREARREQRYEREEYRRFEDRPPRYEDAPRPRERPPRPEFERRPPPRDFPEERDVPPPPPSRGRPDPE